MKSIRNHIEKLFKGTPHNAEIVNIKEELIQNLEEKVIDLMASGKTEEDAINKALIDLGDIEDIKNELLNKNIPTKRIKTRNKLHFSLWASFMTIALFMFMNFYYTPKVIWFIYPTFVILWWPMFMFYKWRESK